MITQLYNKCLKLAGHKNSNYFLAVVSFFESSFFPIPPDVMIVPMAISKRKFMKIFLIATIFSVLGGMFGYLIGAFFFDFAINIIEFYNYDEKVINLKTALKTGGSFYTWLGILFLAGFTPLPYKVFTISSGLIGFNFFAFIFISIISRGLRFFIVSFLSYKFGNKFTEFMNQYGQKWFTIVGIIVIAIFTFFYLLTKLYG